MRVRAADCEHIACTRHTGSPDSAGPVWRCALDRAIFHLLLDCFLLFGVVQDGGKLPTNLGLRKQTARAH